MNNTTEEARAARRARHEAIRAEVAQEEAEAAEAEIAEKAGALDMPLHLRIDRELDAQLRRRAAAEHIPTSALVRRLLRQAVHELSSGGLTTAEVEDIARRVAREELHKR
ncbi:MAG: ribbon-helix-helix protein, CopG family [Actinomycetota bacterium]|nr:ribbon-helix-helix protein, CopG family [Actinomycetota bacterium]